ncbi:hypothetical protein [Flavobacterium sp.]|uniref:hypothetical protein n=1 Tax=Flavobacterium sp. TaxID=239 RepID=UPI0011F90762|nr:hypothetical protein [Flavobacterium sp.]RZJ72857.1 MAG: hypothetical protein EOO49_04280 [Flavobacterium sp.]
MVFVAILVCALVMYGAIYLMSNGDKLGKDPKNENAAPNTTAVEETARRQAEERDNAIKAMYANAEFTNKNCEKLEDFVIDEKMNAFDLRKLADLNEIQLQISQAWYPITIELVKEIHKNGWNKKVSCIKEKYARLEFYADCKYEGTVYNIIEKYGKLSEHVCETCGERGQIRHSSGWDYVACRKHYLENRGKIAGENSGFVHNGNRYDWSDAKNAVFDDFDHNEKFRFLKLEFRKTKVAHAGWMDNKLYVSSKTIGFGKFLSNLPEAIEGLEYAYADKFRSVEYCDICGYEAVYLGECECCENTSWESHQKRWKEKEEGKCDYIKYRQLWWTLDEGETYESQQKNYPKNPRFQMLFTSEELEESKRRESEANFD